MAPLIGWTGAPDYFRFVERDVFEPDLVEDVLRGRLAGVVYRGAFADGLRPILSQFADHPARTRRDDAAAGYYLGAYHYGKPTRQYLHEAADIAADLQDVLGHETSPWRRFRRELGRWLARRGIDLRLARHEGMSACPGAIRSWEASGRFSLVPHEDASQCRAPEQRGFEIQRVLTYEVCAANLCLENAAGGQLIYWNVKPDESTKRRCGTFYTGGAYAAEALAGAEHIKLDVGPGDLYVFNGGHVHAVLHGSGPRSTVASLLGFRDERTVITWT